MYIAIDETGSFREGKDLEYGIVTLVTITDNEWRKFRSLMDALYPNGWSDIKGKTIDDGNREKILKYIGTKYEIKYTSLLFDLKFGIDELVKYQRNGQVRLIKESIDSLKINNGHKSLIDELELMARRLNAMSNADFSKFMLIYELYREWMQYYQFDFIHIYKANDSWDLNHIIDTQTKSENFKTILNQMLILTTNHLNPEFKIFSPQELRNIKHPFELKHSIMFEGRSVLDGHKVFRNLKISNEQNEPVLLLPDLIGNTIHRSIKYRYEKKWLKMLKRIMSNRSITMNNKFRIGKNNYYLIRGFDRNMNQENLNLILQEHHTLMNHI
ncbi:MAG: hypothetical protein WAV51_02445 [Microgenomates group bacterium]